MVEEIRDNLFRIEIPLPQNPLKALNSYFIRGDKRNLLIDTGFNRDECREAMDRALKELDIDMETTDIFITHIHSDHSGLAGYLAGPGTDVYTGEYTRMGLCNPDSMSYFGDMVKQSGLLEMGLSTDLSIHPGYRFRTIQVKNVKVVKDGDIIQVGDYFLQCINTTGHAPDHMCLYEQKHKLLFSGDHILGKGFYLRWGCNRHGNPSVIGNTGHPLSDFPLSQACGILCGAPQHPEQEQFRIKVLEGRRAGQSLPGGGDW
jgi:glyoxylase-like metal-dependent hydrolase (beta-lactamase superfamily II)